MHDVVSADINLSTTLWAILLVSFKGYILEYFVDLHNAFGCHLSY